MYKKVYIVDDEEVTLYLTSLMVSLYAPECVCVSFQDASSALGQLELDLAKGELPDTLLVDLNMPFMDGFALLDALEQMFAGQYGIPHIYVLTSSVNKADRIASIEHHLVTDVIEKPLTEEKLQEMEQQKLSNCVFPRKV